MIPKWIYLLIVIVVLASLVPFALIARSRWVKSGKTRIRLVQDMGAQSSYRPQSENPLFADGRGMRPRVPGTVARGELRYEPAVASGRSDDQWLAEIPLAIDMPALERGRERYGIYCAPCHGLAGSGDGIVARRAEQLQEGTWVPPLSFHDPQVRSRPAGHLFNTITNGIRNMPAYGPQIPVEDRWKIVAYVRALQLSQDATLDDVPAEFRGSLR
ncbi:MAG: cytochrome c [Acidobacteria bacterium]|nr:cytochrome c [Acidobacteriota bacterium]